ncbi:GH36-type glycosyl hydrolase domain-containing protein [Novosphingobium album (ex Liu et al. 2023)]|uniref:Glucoamylase family protein n=1 Tax=Novosphingobium album (ex Liu et al. 2023) TaxID=3031130 RepID=A0ABT5WT98_9SPHN|nr:glucoamylase family protein [Novosphingobium album (ex Liu et al. 2023)]MDE8652797.1 glucoamylase family protein [Novosphingobium album (ex Liu et al. 2023)]
MSQKRGDIHGAQPPASIFGLGDLFKGFGRTNSKPPWNDTAAIREVIFSVERMEEHARSLAQAQLVKPHRQLGHPLLDRLAANEASLIQSYRSILAAVVDKAAITPAAEWLIDNFHLVERQIREIRLDLPPGYYRQLPKLADGPFQGLPRVFGLVWAFVAHTDSRFDSNTWCAYIHAYQEVQPLTIGELWASAITLRIILIENLRRIAERIVYSRDERRIADEIADRLLSAPAADQTEDDLIDELGPAAPSDALALQLIHRLRDQSPALTAMLGRLDDRLAADGRTTDSAIHDEQQRQIAANVTVRNIITSMRHISDVDWAVLFERISLVDLVLAKNCDFAQMDFATRNLYRTSIEKLARGSGREELDVAHRAIDASAGAVERRRQDPGYYLTAEGRPDFEAALGYRPSLWALVSRAYRALGVGGYAGAGALVALLLLGFPVIFHVEANMGWLLLGVLGLLGSVPAIDSAVSLVNQIVTRQFGVTQIPGLELREGIPASLRTLVVVPTLLTRPEAVLAQVEQLEIHHLASVSGDIQFALLSDWTDAESESVEGDELLLQAAIDAIAGLNRKHPPAPGGNRFLLLHRRRVWNESQRRWIGWERKRGKLHELNRLLRGEQDTTFVTLDGRPPAAPEGVRYVITLDADTRLPPDTVRRLIGKMAHPLNQPVVDPARRRVIEGYAILQPRVTPNLPVGDEGSAYQRVFSSPSGIDPYSAAVSDVYQDLFGEGSYAGKGIYALDAFETVLADRVPDSTLLSHDLFEGVFARTGLASDVEVVESFPTRYDVASLRYHRWTRGDWQLLPWILGWSPLLGQSRRMPAQMPASGRWKMVDNLRRSVTPLTCVLALFAGWALPFNAALVWTLFFLATLALPSLSPVLASVWSRHPGIPTRVHFARILSDFGSALAQILLIVILLAHQAWLMGDAVVRTLLRLFVTRRNLLQWTPAAQATIGRDPTIGAYCGWMAGAVVIGTVAIAGTAYFGDGTVYLAAPFGVLWVLSPLIARWVSRPSRAVAERPLADADRQALRLTARQTWRYFETFVTPSDHMLPPDNFQEVPSPVLARRTSPTNIGLYLLSAASAHDFGWLGTLDTIERLEATMATIARLDRYRGHFYNWYDTESLRVLDPQYVSSVDSGNLAGQLIALAGACEDWCRQPHEDARRIAGIADTLALVREEVETLRDRRRTETVTWRQLDEALALLLVQMDRPAAEGEALAARLERLAGPAELLVDLAKAFAVERGEDAADILFWARAVCHSIASHQRDIGASDELAARLTAIARTAREMALAMEFDFLLNEERQLLSIGFAVRDGALDESCYDLLASEARLASFFAIAKGDLPARHWFRLGHSVTPVAGDAALLSWSGSMFEYLMPALIMRAPSESIIGRTNRAVIRKQIDYARSLATPWGISESAYNARDLEHTYQYSNFGIPDLGLKRGLGEEAVIAPYATALAAIIDPVAAARNFSRLATYGARGRFGFFEALDFTPRRLLDGQTVAVVHAFMAHHQGMTIVAIADALLGDLMRERFHAEPIVHATELLLHERMPREIAAAPAWASDVKPDTRIREFEALPAWREADPHAAFPATHLLSNGRYSVMLTAAGSGYSRWRDLAVTRWREDATCDDWGSFIYLRDVESDQLWSATHQPTSTEPDEYSVAFSEERATFSRQDGDFHTTLEVVVSTEDDAEVRRLTLANNGRRPREIEVTSYAEIAIAPQAADIAHPVFSKLFVETEYVARLGAILATRRRRSPDEPEIWAAHHSVASSEGVGKAEFETDRARFLGRGLGVRTPAAALDGRLLSRSTGAVLDPVFVLRRRVRLAPGAAVRIDFWTLVAESREDLIDAVDKTNDISAFGRAVTLAWTQSQVELHHLGIDRDEASAFQRLAGHLIYAGPALRPSSEVIVRGAGPQSGLWPQSISGDLPIILLRIANVEDIRIVHQLLQAMEYWRARRLEVDLVILNERASSYVQDLQITIENTLRTSQARRPVSVEGATGQVFVLRADLIPSETSALLASTARVRLTGDGGGLAEQLGRIREPAAPTPAANKTSRHAPQPRMATAPKLELFNGVGGFADEGHEYVITLGPGQATPAPWINVIANQGFGFQVSAEGCGFSWSVNSREHQLTPWSNDPVTDRPGEAVYLRDEDSGELWSPTALPIRDDAGIYVARHGWGYSRFEHEAHGIASELLVYVPVADPIKITRLKLRNTTNSARRLSVTAYVEWVLGTSRAAAAPFVCTKIDPELNAMFARNPWNAAFARRVAFLDLGGRQTSWTADRREFIGRNGCLSDPIALSGAARLSGAVGAGFDPCGAMSTTVDLAPGAETEIVILFGDADGPELASALIARYRDADLDAVLAEVHGQWEDLLGTVRVKTPDRSMDIMLNGWLLYQTIACRLWARSGFYQASGAYGFRDQLQDGMALAAIRPSLTREHLIRAAGRQFPEGDVQHWWLPHSGQGVRTRISDDRIWLAYCVAHYLETTGDTSLLDETMPFLEGPKLNEDQHDSFFAPTVSERIASVYEHCALALDASLARGAHGLPLIGGGDWNDGMNRVGEQGKGESVWLAWLSHMALTRFAAIAQARNQAARASQWRAEASKLQEAIEREAWDGSWYRRAWFDDGTAIGSAANDECRIDSIAQSWAVISNAANAERASRAMAAVERELIRSDDGLALLFTPPFDRTAHDPGYIKGYPPGIRENGGQYTHGAIWSIIALARLGEGEKAAGLFSLLNPINHARNRSDLRRYKVEPYVVSADVYAAADHVGRGGWTWYTGSAAWLYRAGMEEILGLRLQGSSLHLDPCIPNGWPGFEIALRRDSTRFDIRVGNPGGIARGVASATMDGTGITERPLRFDLPDDGKRHEILVTMG